MSETELSEEEKACSKRFKKEEKGSTSSPHKYEYGSSDEERDWRSCFDDIDTESPKELQYAVGRCFRSKQDEWTFVDKLAETPPVVEAAEKLLKSLKGDGNGCTPSDCEAAFKELWGDEVFLNIIRNGCQQNPYFSSLLLAYDNDDLVSRHDERMSYVKDDPILKIELGPSALVMRKAMCLSLIYWFDSAVFETLGLRDFLSQEVEPEIVEIKYKTKSKDGDEGLRVELQKLYGGDDDKFNKALNTILDSQREFEYLVDDMNKCVTWTVSYEPEEGLVGAMRISRLQLND